MLKIVLTTTLMLAPAPVLAQAVSNATGTVRAEARAYVTGDEAAQTNAVTGTTLPLALATAAEAVATGQGGGNVRTATASSATWAANGLSGTVDLSGGWDFAGRTGDGGMGANFGIAPSWSYALTLDRAATLTFDYAVTGTGRTFGLHGWSFALNDVVYDLAGDDAVFDPSASGRLTLSLDAGTAYVFALQSIGNIGGFELSNYAASQSGTFAFSIAAAAAAVPEPATWALMILGFGAVGGAVRRRRTAPAVAAA